MNPETRVHLRRTTRRRRLTALALAGSAAGATVAAAAFTTTATSAAADPGKPGDRLAVARAATAKYHDIDVALADGYIPVSECVEGPDGAMGIHYMNPALAAEPVDLRHPAFLLYLPDGDDMRLIGIEYFQADADQDLTTDSDRPSLLGQAFDGPMPGHGPGAPVHYDLHVWIWSHNPDGMYAEYNSALSC